MTHSTPTDADLAALRWACLVNPFDLTARGVYADALEEVGDDGRAEWIRSSHADHSGMQYSASAAMCREYRPYADVPGWIPGSAICVIRRGFLEELHVPLSTILDNLNVFRVCPIVAAMATNKIPYAAFMPYEPTEYHWYELHDVNSLYRLPRKVFQRLTMGVLDLDYRRVYTDPHEPAEDLSRAIVSLGREHAGLPQLRWPT